MRSDADRRRIDALLMALGRRVRSEHTVYLAGGASAVIEGWRSSTIDVDLLAVPDDDEILSALHSLKDELDINIETASPLDFLPAAPGWEERSPYIRRDGLINVRHMDFALQALSKLERGSERDLADVAAMAERSLITPERMRSALDHMRRRLFRYPAVDERSFVGRAEAFIDQMQVG